MGPTPNTNANLRYQQEELSFLSDARRRRFSPSKDSLSAGIVASYNGPYKGKLEGLSYIPKPYEKPVILSKNLDIANLVEEDKKMRERAEFFVCLICAMVVLNPSECSGCQSLYCADCIALWREKNNYCPKKCQGNEAVEFRQVHRLVQ